MLTIKKRQDFLDIRDKGESIVASGLILQARKNSEITEPRLGFTVTKKVGNAVIRNRVKRRLRAACRQVISTHGEVSDYVVIGRHSTLKRPFDKLLGDLKYALKNVYKAPNNKK